MYNRDKFFDRGFEPVNVDIGYRCPLQCPSCGRQCYDNSDGRDLTIDEFKKIAKLKRITFCGQYSDPIHHPNFIDFLKICEKEEVYTQVRTASSFKPKDWYIEAFKANPNAIWYFGIDGLPEESHNYRVNQDGIKLFNIMLESKKYLLNRPRWQYIIFKYNQDHADEAMALAKEHELDFIIINSIRESDKPDLRATIKV
jgi:MoaA/NifB/PqqE/SkfB family radical SAM enzyme